MKAQCQARQIFGEVFIETKLISYRWLELAACGAFSESNLCTPSLTGAVLVPTVPHRLLVLLDCDNYKQDCCWLH